MIFVSKPHTGQCESAWHCLMIKNYIVHILQNYSEILNLTVSGWEPFPGRFRTGMHLGLVKKHESFMTKLFQNMKLNNSEPLSESQ